MFAQPISMSCFKSIIFFIKIALKLNYFCKKFKIFERWGHRPQTPVPTAAGSFAPKPPSPAAGGFVPRPLIQPPIANFWLYTCSQFYCATRESYPQVSKVAFRVLLSFATTYLCESGFSALVHIKNESTKSKKSRR